MRKISKRRGASWFRGSFDKAPSFSWQMCGNGICTWLIVTKGEMVCASNAILCSPLSGISPFHVDSVSLIKLIPSLELTRKETALCTSNAILCYTLSGLNPCKTMTLWAQVVLSYWQERRYYHVHQMRSHTHRYLALALCMMVWAPIKLIPSLVLIKKGDSAMYIKCDPMLHTI